MQCSDIGDFIFFEYAPSSLYSKTLESMLKIDPSNRLTPLKYPSDEFHNRNIGVIQNPHTSPGNSQCQKQTLPINSATPRANPRVIKFSTVTSTCQNFQICTLISLFQPHRVVNFLKYPPLFLHVNHVEWWKPTAYPSNGLSDPKKT